MKAKQNIGLQVASLYSDVCKELGPVHTHNRVNKHLIPFSALCIDSLERKKKSLPAIPPIPLPSLSSSCSPPLPPTAKSCPPMDPGRALNTQDASPSSPANWALCLDEVLLSWQSPLAFIFSFIFSTTYKAIINDPNPQRREVKSKWHTSVN